MFEPGPRAKISKQPSLYPPLAFHLLRAGQFLSSAIVLSILAFFVHYLHVEHFYVPWTFLLLLTVAVLTLTSLLATAALHQTRTLPPKLNLPLNALCATLWALGFALLTWNISPLLGNRCTPATWRNESGIMVCRLYKALATFTITGLISTSLSLLLDLRTHRLATRRGTYNPMHDIKPVLPASPHPAHHDDDPFHHHQHDDPSHHNDDPYQQRRVSHELSRPYKVQRPIEAGHFGYSAPSEQTTYAGRDGVHGL